jgi:hypothetical protein
MRRTQRRVLLRVTSLRLRGQDAAALCYCCAIMFFEVSEFQQLPHGGLRHTAPSLRLFVPNSLTVSRHSFLLRALLATFVAGVLFRGDHSPTATSAPSLDQLVPSDPLISYQQARVIIVIQNFLLSSQSLFQHNHPNFSSLSLTQWGLKLNGVAGAPTSTYPVLILLAALFSILVVAYFSTRSIS